MDEKGKNKSKNNYYYFNATPTNNPSRVNGLQKHIAHRSILLLAPLLLSIVEFQ
jgi:hypothetical protein